MWENSGFHSAAYRYPVSLMIFVVVIIFSLCNFRNFEHRCGVVFLGYSLSGKFDIHHSIDRVLKNIFLSDQFSDFLGSDFMVTHKF